jgi:hypothetical protein
MTPVPVILRRGLYAAVISAWLAVLPGAVQAQEPVTFRDRLSFQLGLGYAEETHSDSPAGDISFQAGATYDLAPRFDVGLVVGYYDAGEARLQTQAGSQEWSLSVIPVFAQVLYDFQYWSTARLFGAAGAGSYTKRVRGAEECDCTDFGLNLGAGIMSPRGLGPLGYALEFRYHYLPQEGGEGNQFLSLIGSLNIP